MFGALMPEKGRLSNASTFLSNLRFEVLKSYIMTKYAGVQFQTFW